MQKSHWILSLCACLVMAGCAETLRNKQLEKVAKDWSIAVRASQIIPYLYGERQVDAA